MSLKAFHLFFIAVSTLLAVGLGVWSFRSYLAGGSGLDLLLAVVAGAGVIGLPIYGTWFLAKTKHMSFL